MAGTVLQAFVFRDGNFLGTEMITGDRIEIGRDPLCGLVLDDDDLVSRKHAILHVRGSEIWVEDLGSANGTIISGEPLKGTRRLGSRDDVFVGHYTLKIKLLAAAPAVAAPPVSGPSGSVLADNDATKVHTFDPDSTVLNPQAAAPPAGLPAPGQTQTAPPAVTMGVPTSDPWRDLSSSAPGSPQSAARPSAAAPASSSSSLGDELFADVSGIHAHPSTPLVAAPKAPPPVAPPAAPAHRAAARPGTPQAAKPARGKDPFAALLQAQPPGAASELTAPLDSQPDVELPAIGGIATSLEPMDGSTSEAAAAQAPAIEATAQAAAPVARVAEEGPLPARPHLSGPDDDDDDPNDAPAPFSLLENLLRETFKEGRVKQMRRPLLEVIRYQGDVVEELTSLGKGQTYVLGRGLSKKFAETMGLPANFKMARMGADGSAVVAVQKDFKGKVRQGGSSRPLAEAASWSGDKGKIELKTGDIANLQVGSENYFLRFAFPPAVVRDINTRGTPSPEQKKEVKWIGLSFMSSGAGHLAVLVAMFITSLLSPPQMATQLDEDRFVQVDQKELELEKPEEPQPEEPEPVEEAPPEDVPPEPQPKKRSRQRLTHPSGKSKKPGILAALGKIPKRSGAAGSQTLTAAVSNLDAVKVPGGGASYKVSGLIGKRSTKRLRIGGSGGGVATRGLASILREGGGGPGTLRKLRNSKVRGRLVKASRGSKMKGKGYLDRAEIQKVVNKGLGQIQFCYEKELLKNQSLSGKVAFEWTIAPTGRVSIVKTSTSTLKSARAVQCMIGRIRGWKFPKPRGNGSVIVTYPFIFNAMGF